ncbi:MAG TPA: Crp/Fnr family transcriptional regulator [Gammaproteobacteria bacterium]|nr:Crp/Fnr family transcriptional regulator [Gammaproteobacteria bacterium]
MDNTMTIAENNKEFLASEECSLCPTREIALFANLKPEDLLQMHSPIQYKVFEKGDELYAIGQEADYIYTLHDGVLKLEQYLPTGEQRIVRILRRGDLAGIEAVTATNYQHDAIAMTKISVCKIPADIVLDLSLKSPELHENLMNKWQSALTTSDTWLTRLSTGPSRYRVVRLLIWLSENSLDEAFYIPGREDMGNILSLTTETVSRTIAGLRRDGDIELKGSNSARANVSNLKKIVREPT